MKTAPAGNDINLEMQRYYAGQSYREAAQPAANNWSTQGGLSFLSVLSVLSVFSTLFLIDIIIMLHYNHTFSPPAPPPTTLNPSEEYNEKLRRQYLSQYSQPAFPSDNASPWTAPDSRPSSHQVCSPLSRCPLSPLSYFTM